MQLKPVLEKVKEQAHLSRFPQFCDLEILKATYITHTFPRHFHRTFVIEVVESGTDEFFCGGKLHQADPGSIVVFNPHEVHTGRSVGKEPLKYRSMYPSIRLIEKFFNNQIDSLQFPHKVIWDPGLASRISALHDALETCCNSLKIKSQLESTLSELVLSHAELNYRSNSTQSPNCKLAKVKKFLIDNFSKNITLAELAQISGLSSFHLLRAFRDNFDLPPYKFLVNLRIEHAKKLLSRNYPIAHVAYESGFYDQSHLNRHFKQIVGVTPGQYH